MAGAGLPCAGRHATDERFTLADLDAFVAERAAAVARRILHGQAAGAGPVALRQEARRGGGRGGDRRGRGRPRRARSMESADRALSSLGRASRARHCRCRMCMAELERRTARRDCRRRRRADKTLTLETRDQWHGAPAWTRASTPPADDLSPYRVFTRDEWAALRADTPLTLTVDDSRKLQSLNDPISLEEVVAIYLPLSRLLVALCRGDAGAVQGDAALPRRRATARCPTSSASPARSRSASRPPRACCRRCWRAGRTRPRSISSPPTASSTRTPCCERDGLMERRAFPESYDGRRCCASSPT